ncbi:MAG: D-alanyl-D-alanine carboxypeptidase family protein, partial [Oleiharenicola lentus]
MDFFRRWVAIILLASCLIPAAALDKVSRNPYLGAIVIDDASGQVLFEDNADARGYPASVTKLMTFLVIMDKVHAGQLTLQTPITVSAEASRTGGSQVYLKQGEVFTVDELLYALMIQSANDAAVALAVHAAGSKEAFVELMNAKARDLGMTNTTFHSPHGLPPGKGQQVDLTTARDLATLSRELINHGDVLRYSSVKVRTLRASSANPFEMRNHNHLLGKLAGCDGLKTGYFSAAGYSLSATVERSGRRIITVVLGSEASKTRDFKVMELVEKGFAAPVTTLPVVRTAVAPAKPAPAAPIPTVK